MRLLIIVLAILLSGCTPAQILGVTDNALTASSTLVNTVSARAAKRRESGRLDRLRRASEALCTELSAQEFAGLPEVERLGLAAHCARGYGDE